MAKISSIKLNSSSILNVPLQTYEKDFTFIVNDQEFNTSRLVSDLLSPIISKLHLNDPTIDTFTIKTSNSGNFSQILDLVTFESKSIPSNDIPFIYEVFEILGQDSIDIQWQIQNREITLDNVFSLLSQQERYQIFYRDHFLREITFISSHFYKLNEEQEEELAKLSVDTLYEIFSNEQLRIKTEDQLLRIINKLYSKSSKYSILYETVLFENASKEAIVEFLSTYDVNDVTGSVWKRLSVRLAREVEKQNDKSEAATKERYKENFRRTKVEFEQDELKGIISRLKEKYGENICENGQLNISSGLSYSGSVANLIKYDSDHINDFFRNSAGVPNIQRE